MGADVCAVALAQATWPEKHRWNKTSRSVRGPQNQVVYGILWELCVASNFPR